MNEIVAKGPVKVRYDEGDDEMKRSIKKSWYEANQKKDKSAQMSMPGMEDFPGMWFFSQFFKIIFAFFSFVDFLFRFMLIYASIDSDFQINYLFYRIHFAKNQFHFFDIFDTQSKNQLISQTYSEVESDFNFFVYSTLEFR